MHPNGRVFPPRAAKGNSGAVWERGRCSACVALSYGFQPRPCPRSSPMAVSWRQCACGADSENWAAAVHTCPATTLAPSTALHHGWPDLWPQGVWEGPQDGEILMAKHPAARSWTLPRKPGSQHNLSPGTPSPSPGKAAGERPVPAAPVPGRPLCGHGQGWPQPCQAPRYTRGLRAVLASLQLVCCLFLVGALLFRCTGVTPA